MGRLVGVMVLEGMLSACDGQIWAGVFCLFDSYIDSNIERYFVEGNKVFEIVLALGNSKSYIRIS